MDTINEFRHIICCCLINSDGFGNIIALLELFIITITALVGYFKIDEFRKEAILGFHINLLMFIQRFKFIFPQKVTEAKYSIFSLFSATEQIRTIYTNTEDNKSKEKELSELSIELLKYLSNAQKQAGPKNCEHWSKLILKLVGDLNKFSHIGNGQHYSYLHDENAIVKAHNDFFNLLSKIEKPLLDEQKLVDKI